MKKQIQPCKQGVMSRKVVTALCALIAVLVVCTSVIGGTLAYLKQVTPEIKNFFELGDLTYVLEFEENDPKPEDANIVEDMPTSMTRDPAAVTEQVFVVETIPTLTGYTFLGWDDPETAEEALDYPLSEDGTHCNVKVEYNPAKYENGTTTKTVNAVWQPITYTVEYAKNDDDTETKAEGITASSTHTYDVEQKLTENGYTRKGYTFIGWNTKADGSGDLYADKQSVVNLTNAANGKVTLYAQWGAKSYSIRYNANGGEGTMLYQVIKYDVPTALFKNEFTKEDYTFFGWALTPDGEAKYIDEQIVVNLLESGTLDLYAVWEQDSHTVHFDYNGGTGSPASKQVQNGKAYGQLPEYPTKHHHLFAGWYTAPEGGTRVYPSTIVNSTEDHTLYAQWKYSPANEIIQDLVIKNNPDDNFDGVVDDIYLNFACSSYFEKFNVPLENLVKGQKYKLTFTESNDATFGENINGYGGAIYGSIITKDGTLDKGSIKDESANDGGLIAVYDDQFDKGNAWLNGPRDWTMYFTAEASTMYWTWDMGLIQDGPLRNYNFRNIELVPVEPKIEFANKTLLKPSAYNAMIVSETNGQHSTTFVFDGSDGCETIYYPITGLTAGSTYTITFDHTFTGGFVNTTGVYEYGCGIMTTKPADSAMSSKMSGLGTFASGIYVDTTLDDTQSVTLTFTASGDTAYWVWNMANASDSKQCKTEVTVTKFSVKHQGGGSMTYYSRETNSLSAPLMMAAPILPVDIVVDLADSVSVALPNNETVSGAGNISLGTEYLGQDCALTITGTDLPQVLKVNINSWLYVTGVNETLVQSVTAATSGESKPEWIEENADGSQTLIIPAELMTSSAIITISGDHYDAYDLSSITIEDLI